jgi:hypothetical protein
LAFAGVLAHAEGASAYCRMTTDVGDPTEPAPCKTDASQLAEGERFLAWNRRCIEYAVDMRGTESLELGEIQSVAQASFATWADVACDAMPVGFSFREAEGYADCQKPQFNRSGGNVNVIAFVPALEVDDPSIIALTSVWFSTSSGLIYDADIMINEQQGPYAICPCEAGGDEQDLQNVLTHEIGHFLGLAHSSEPGATMEATARPGETQKRDLTADDEAGLCAAYPADSLPETCDFTPKGGLDLDCNHGEGRGCAVTAAPGASSSPAGAAGVPLLVVTALVATGLRRRLGRR